jgi:hypothetical protein
LCHMVATKEIAAAPLDALHVLPWSHLPAC